MLSIKEWRLREFGEEGQAPVAPVQPQAGPTQALPVAPNPQEEAEAAAAEPEIEEILKNSQLASLLQRVFVKFKNLSTFRKKKLLQLVVNKLMNPDIGRGLSQSNIKQTVQQTVRGT